MFSQYRTIVSLLGMTILPMLVLVLSGCGGPIRAPSLIATSKVISVADTPTPTPETIAVAATPVVKILKNPNSTEVPNGGQVALSVEATGVNLKIEWHVARGTLSTSEGISTIYNAPDTPGLDTVDVTVTSDSGSTTKTVTFTVTEMPTEMPTSTLIPLAATSTPSPLPPPRGAVAITLLVDGTKASGAVSGLDSDQYQAHKVIVYLETDKWYIQPVLGGYATIGDDGSWKMQALKVIPGVPTIAYAYLAKMDYQPPNESVKEPQVDYVNIVAKATPVTVQQVATPAISASPVPVTPSAASMTLSVSGITASGKVSGLDPDQYPAYKVLVYLKTDLWYIQPVLGGSASIQADGTWQMSELKIIAGVPTEAHAYLARRDFQAPDVSPQGPQVDGVDIIARAEPVQVH